MKNQAFYKPPYPWDVVEFEDDEESKPVRKRKISEKNYIEGDDLVQIMSGIASELYERGQEQLACEMVQFISEALGGT